MAKILVQFPYLLKPGSRMKQAEILKKQWEENDIIIIDAGTKVTIIKEDDYIIPVDYNIWFEINENTINSLEDHNWYLVCHRDYDTPIKAKFHRDSFCYFELCTSNGVKIEYLYAGFNEDPYILKPNDEHYVNKITHFMLLPTMPEERKHD